MTSPVPGTHSSESSPSRQTLMRATPARLVDDDLCIGIRAGSFDEWRGTRAQLQTTGLVPSRIVWPTRTMCARWCADGFHFYLQRCRPDGSIRSTMRGLKEDYWFVRRVRPHPWLNPLNAARVRELFDELQDIRFRSTPAGYRLWLDWFRAQGDEKFQAFKAFVMPVKKKPGRRSWL